MSPRLLAFLFATTAGACTAQDLELSAGGGVTAMGGNSLGFLGFGGGNTPANEVKHYGGTGLSFRFTFNMSRWLGHEFGVCYSRSKFASRSTT